MIGLFSGLAANCLGCLDSPGVGKTLIHGALLPAIYHLLINANCSEDTTS